MEGRGTAGEGRVLREKREKTTQLLACQGLTASGRVKKQS